MAASSAAFVSGDESESQDRDELRGQEVPSAVNVLAAAEQFRFRRSHGRASGLAQGRGRGGSPTQGPRYSVLSGERLGSGSFGSEYKAFESVSGTHVAAKRTIVDPTQKVAVEALETEFAMLKNLGHPNIVKVLEYNINVRDGDSLVAEFFMEWMSNGSVQTLIEQTQFRLHESIVRRCFTDALKGLAYLHSKNVVHRDIKPGNMLVDGDGVVKLSDFGTSVQQGIGGQGNTQVVMVGTLPYLAPECFTEGTYGPASDMWALACSVVEMASGIVPWTDILSHDQRNPASIAFHIGTAQPPRHCPTIPPHISPQLRTILQSCFEPVVPSRPSATDLLQLPYFDESFSTSHFEDMKEYRTILRDRQRERQSASSSDELGGSGASSESQGVSGVSSWSQEYRSTLQGTFGSTTVINLVRQ